MPDVEIRFHGELNDFLPPVRRDRRFAYRSAEHASAKHAIEALGVPHTEVGPVFVDDARVDLGHALRSGDRIDVHPWPACIAAGPGQQRPGAADDTRFVADAHLGRLARYLRFIGYDTLHHNAWDDRGLVGIAGTQQRIVLTRDRALLMHRDLARGCYVRAVEPLAQLRQVVERFGLDRARERAARCLLCNTPLERADKSAVTSRIPPATRAHHEHYWHCPTCDRVYWRGSHWQRLQRRVGEVLAG